MAKYRVKTTSGLTLYAVITNGSLQFWNQSGTPAFEPYNAANWTGSKYCIALAETGAGYYSFNFPSAAGMVLGDYDVVIYDQAGGAPAITDDPLPSHGYVWNGAAELTLSTALDRVDATISSRSTYAGGAVASVTAGVTVAANNDKTGYGLSAAAVQAVWDALTSAMVASGSIGKKLKDWALGSDNKVLLSADAQTGVTIPTVTTIANPPTAIATIADLIEADRVIDTAVNPWALVLIKRGTGELGEPGAVELLRQKLYDVAGGPVTNIATVLGRSIT